MHPDAIQFVRQWLAVAAGSLFVVMLSAFLFVPLSLGYHPGDMVATQERHMT